MITHHTIRFGPAVSRKDLEKALHEESHDMPRIPDLTKMKARIEVIGDFEDLRAISEVLKQRSNKSNAARAS